MIDDPPEKNWDVTWYLISLGMNRKEAEAWVKARKGRRSFKLNSTDELGACLDRISERNMKNAYVETTALEDELIRSSLAAMQQRWI